MRAAGVPIVPGTTAPVADAEEAARAAEEIGYPVALKAAGGGGGKGFRVAETPEQLEKAFDGAAGEGERFFGDPTVYVERYLPDPRHVEVQVLADAHGNVVHLGERDCSVQRRHQKLIEESPAPGIDAALREKIARIGVDAARAVGYRSAGTIEGLLSEDGEFFFLEMNTRVQVEHCVTEMVTGLDIVREQILIAAGEPLSFTQDDMTFSGHAIECRINAEDAAKNFIPAPGAITAYKEPAGHFVRVDSGVEDGSQVLPYYDPMIAKVIVWDRDRESATRRMLRALHEYEIEGLKTLLPFHQRAAAHAAVGRRRDLPRSGHRPRLAQGACATPSLISASASSPASASSARVDSPSAGASERTAAGRSRSLIAGPICCSPTIPRSTSCGSRTASARSFTRTDAGVAPLIDRQPLVPRARWRRWPATCPAPPVRTACR